MSPVAAQLVGCDPAVMADAAQVCVERGAVLVDVNLGCPVPKVVSRGSGAALARDVSATARVVAAMVDAVDVPVTVKMRLGWDASTINAPELARALAGRRRRGGHRARPDPLPEVRGHAPTGPRSPGSRRR